MAFNPFPPARPFEFSPRSVVIGESPRPSSGDMASMPFTTRTIPVLRPSAQSVQIDLTGALTHKYLHEIRLNYVNQYFRTKGILSVTISWVGDRRQYNFADVLLVVNEIVTQAVAEEVFLMDRTEPLSPHQRDSLNARIGDVIRRRIGTRTSSLQVTILGIEHSGLQGTSGSSIWSGLVQTHSLIEAAESLGTRHPRFEFHEIARLDYNNPITPSNRAPWASYSTTDTALPTVTGASNIPPISTTPVRNRLINEQFTFYEAPSVGIANTAAMNLAPSMTSGVGTADPRHEKNLCEEILAPTQTKKDYKELAEVLKELKINVSVSISNGQLEITNKLMYGSTVVSEDSDFVNLDSLKEDYE